jgi:hypothetical protein
MKPELESKNLIITLFAPEILPSFLTEKFLKESTVIPKDWQLAELPDIGESEALAVFTNGVQISAEKGAIFFSENLTAKQSEQSIIPSVVMRWVQIWSKQINHYGIAIKPNSFYSFTQNNIHQPNHYITSELLISNTLDRFSQDSVRATLELLITSNKGNFLISIEDVLLQQQRDNAFKAGVLFKGNFNYDLSNLSGTDRQKALYKYINSWQEDWDKFHQILNQKFFNLN